MGSFARVTVDSHLLRCCDASVQHRRGGTVVRGYVLPRQDWHSQGCVGVHGIC